MMYCVSLCKLKFVFPCANVIEIQGSVRHSSTCDLGVQQCFKCIKILANTWF